MPPIGIEDYSRMILDGYYYVDKTLFIKELLDAMAGVNVFLRPRRFGKTLALSTLKYFFEDTGDETRNAANRTLFNGTKIMLEDAFYKNMMTSFPVVSLTFKSAKQPTLREALYELKSAVAYEFRRLKPIIGNALDEPEMNKYIFLASSESCLVDSELWNTSLRFLCDCLFTATGKRAIILIDEYDVPLENAFFCNFYDEIIGFLRSLLESALKTNPQLEFAVITGCLRVSRESFFTGLNNIRIISILHNLFGEYFGFTQAEVDCILEYYGLNIRREDIRDWYNGYKIGGVEVYNPWSVINTLDYLNADPECVLLPHWVNTSSNEIVRALIERADSRVRDEIEGLVAGEIIEKPVREDITYADMLERNDNLWNFLFFTGYLTMAGERRLEDVRYIIPVRIPNLEVRYAYENIILAWFEKRLESRDLTPFYIAIRNGDANGIENAICDALMDTISFYDYKESYYHGFLAGMLQGINGFTPRSNRESGTGRSDITLTPQRSSSTLTPQRSGNTLAPQRADITLTSQRPGNTLAPQRTSNTPTQLRSGITLTPFRSRDAVIIIEIKVANNAADLEKACDAALNQIEERNYEADARAEGYVRFLHIGVAFYKKDAVVRCRWFCG